MGLGLDFYKGSIDWLSQAHLEIHPCKINGTLGGSSLTMVSMIIPIESTGTSAYFRFEVDGLLSEWSHHLIPVVGCQSACFSLWAQLYHISEGVMP